MTETYGINKYRAVVVFSLPYDFLNNILFSLTSFIVRIQHIIQVTYRMYQSTVIGKTSGQQQVSSKVFVGAKSSTPSLRRLPHPFSGLLKPPVAVFTQP